VASRSRNSKHTSRPRRRTKRNQRVYRARRLAVLALTLAILVGLYYGLDWLLTLLLGRV